MLLKTTLFSGILSTILMSASVSVHAQDTFFPKLTVETPPAGSNKAPVYTPPIGSDNGANNQANQLSPTPEQQYSQPPVYSQPPAVQYVQPLRVPTNEKPTYIPPIERPVFTGPHGDYPGTNHTGYNVPGHYPGFTGSPYFYTPGGASQLRGPLGTNISSYNGGYGAGGNYNQGYQYGASYGNSYGTSYTNSGYGYGNSSYGYGGGGAGGDPYNYHFGPGFYRSGEYGHYRFPNYSYRRPWFTPGFAGYNRDTNLPW